MRVRQSSVFHAGTRLEGNEILTNGGRVLCVTALGDSVTSARDNAYRAVAAIGCDALFHRTDIAYRALAREAAPATAGPGR